MSAFSLDSGHDVHISAGQLARVSGVDEVVQKITTKYKHFRGEWRLDTESGTAWWEKIFTRPGGLPAAEAELKRVITTTSGVTALTEFAAVLSAARRLTVTFEAKTIYGATGEVVISA